MESDKGVRDSFTATVTIIRV